MNSCNCKETSESIAKLVRNCSNIILQLAQISGRHNSNAAKKRHDCSAILEEMHKDIADSIETVIKMSQYKEDVTNIANIITHRIKEIVEHYNENNQ